MTDDIPLPPLRDVIARYDLRARKQLGQNFLLDGNLTAKIARTAGIGPGVTAYEVGPGPGGLTRALLLAGAKHVIAVEKDQRCLGALEELGAAFPNRLTVIAGDALEIDENTLLQGKAPVHLVANLPYNVATPLLIHWLTLPHWPRPFARMTLMFQKEVAERIVAAPGSSAYGRLSVIAQWRTQPAIAFDIPPSAFVPPPKVTSSVVDFRFREKPLATADVDVLQRVTAAAFGQRRKMLRASLKSLGLDAAALCETAQIDATRRAETLSIEEFCALARAVSQAA